MSVVFKVVYFVNLESDRVAHLAPGLFLIPICQPMVFPGNRFLFQERGGQETVNLVKVIPSKAIVKYAFDVRHIKILPKTDRGSLLGQMVRGIIGSDLPSVGSGPNVLPGIEFEGQRLASKVRYLGVE